MAANDVWSAMRSTVSCESCFPTNLAIFSMVPGKSYVYLTQAKIVNTRMKKVLKRLREPILTHCYQGLVDSLKQLRRHGEKFGTGMRNDS